MATPRIVGDSPVKRPFVGANRTKTRSAEEGTLRPMTMEEYNAEIDRALDDYRAGRFISQEDLEKEMETWL